MGNHYHLLLETPEGNLSRGMRHLNGVWSQCFNRRHRKVSHVFQGRYKGIIVQRESYLLELARYVVLNPVRAGLVNAVHEWPWSSYGAMLVGSGAESPVWLETDWLLAQFSHTRGEAVSRYVDFVRAGVGLPSVWEQLQAQVFLGSETFLSEMQARLADVAPLREVPRAQRRPLKTPLADWQAAHPRDAAMALAFCSGQYRQREIAEFFGVHESTVSRGVKRRNSVRSRVPASTVSESQTCG